jgi:hypothetical protein
MRSADLVALNGSRSEPLGLDATDIAYSYLRFASEVTYNVTLLFDPNSPTRPGIESIQSSLADDMILTSALRGAGAPGATVSDVSAVNLSIVTKELAAEFVLALHLDACGSDEQLQDLCIAPRIDNGTLQASFAADLSALLEISIQRLKITAVQTVGDEPRQAILVEITISPSGPGEHTTSATLRRLRQYLASIQSPLFSSPSWFSLAPRDLRVQLQLASDVATDDQTSNFVLSNGTNASFVYIDNSTTTNATDWGIPNGTDAEAIDDGASWNEMPVDCRHHIDGPGCGGDHGDSEEFASEAEEREAIPSTDDSSTSVLVFLVAAYGACMIIVSAFWFCRCRAKRRRARVMSNYSSSPKDDDDDEIERRKPASGFRSLIDPNDLKLIDAKTWRRRDTRRAPSDISSSVASSAEGSKATDVHGAQWELAPEENVSLGSRVQVTAPGSMHLGRVGESIALCLLNLPADSLRLASERSFVCHRVCRYLCY